MQTDRIPIPDAEDAFMEKNQRCFMLTLRKDGSPTGHPMAGFYGGGLWLNMYRVSQKAKNLFRDPSITCVMTTPSDTPNFRGVFFRGYAQELTPEETVAEDAPPGMKRGRAPLGVSEERSERAAPKDAPPDDPAEAKRRLTATAERVAAGTRMLFEVFPQQVDFLEDLRGK